MQNGQQPPKVKVPGSSFGRTLLIGLGFVVAATLYQCAVNTPTTRTTSSNSSALGLPDLPTLDQSDGLDARDVIDILEMQRGEVLEESAPANAANGSYSTDLPHGDVVLETAFGPTWTRYPDGRATVLKAADNNMICMSLVMPADEYQAVMSNFSSLADYERELVEATLPPGVSIETSVQTLFKEAGPPQREGLQLDGLASAGGRSTPISRVSVWTSNTEVAAGLECSETNPTLTGPTRLRDIARAYRLKSTGG